MERPEEPRVAGTSRARVVVLVPAHDEAATMGVTLRALDHQTRRPDRVVVADDCSDNTVAIVRAHGAEVFETVGNTDKKAGALIQARGALENLRHYGLTRTTLRYWGQQVGIGLGVLAFQAYLALIVWVLVAGP